MTDARRELRLGLAPVARGKHLFVRPPCWGQGRPLEAPMGKWLGHRDWCPLQWGEPCTCPCGDIACPGINRCNNPDCVLAKADLASDDTDR